MSGSGTRPRRPDAGPSLGQAVRALADLVLPVACGGCAAADVRWCADCAAVLDRARPRDWRPTPCPPGYPVTVAALRYEGPVRSAVHAWKDEGRRDLGPVLARGLAPALAAVLQAAGEDGHGPPMLVPAPSARGAARRRGERPLPRMVRLALGRPVRGVPPDTRVHEVLRLARPVRDQAGLTARERRTNLAGAVDLRRGQHRRVVGAAVVVVDDVVTTGATLVACAEALRRAGAGSVWAATLAATPLRGPADARGAPPVIGAGS